MTPFPEHPTAVRPAGLHTRRCARHISREAAARCPSCGEFFCRECVVEHDGKLLCASCLAKTTTIKKQDRAVWTKFARLLVATVSVIVLWFVFYGLGALLLKIPPEFHDATVWKSLDDEKTE